MQKKSFFLLIIIYISLALIISCDGGFGDNELKVISSSSHYGPTESFIITVAADAVGKMYDEPPKVDPPLTYTYDPDPLPEGVSITGELVRDAGEVAGTYVIRQGTLELTGPNADKYTLQYVGNKFYIRGYGL